MTENPDVITAFKESYDSLNTAQKQAVDTIEGPVMVIAGPGTGKTQILTLRIANILRQTDTAPESILALTFTESGAKAMKDRLRQYIGAEAYRVPIYTFHGFAQHCISQYPDAYPQIVGGRLITDIEVVELIESIVASGEIKLLSPIGNPAYYVKSIISMIGTLKQEGVTPDRLSEIISQQEVTLDSIEKTHTKGAHKGKVRGEYQKLEKVIAKNKELLLVYKLYLADMVATHRFDFNDMITHTVSALTADEDMLRDLQEHYQYVLADEHQDVNGSQNSILELLSSYHDSPNIFVVGDEKQAIYRFQGASLENFLYFEDAFKGTQTISLSENYRSGQCVLDVAHDLISVPESPSADLRIPLHAAAVDTSVVELRDFSHVGVEDDAVVADIVKKVQDGVEPEEIAVIVRTNKEVEYFASLLRKQAVPASASADGDILTHPITATIRRLIDAVTVSNDETALFECLHASYWKIPHVDVVRIVSARGSGTIAQIISNDERLQELEVGDIQAVTHMNQVLEKAREMDSSQSPHQVLEYLLNESGFLNHIMQHEPLESGRVVRRLYDEVESLVAREKTSSLRAVSKVLSRHAEYNLPLSAPYIGNITNAVQVMTAHKSKGLEFQHVYIPHAVDSIWGGIKRREQFSVPLTRRVDVTLFDLLDDERRLFYVAITRGKVCVSISYSQMNTAGRSLLPTRLLSEVEATLLHEVSTQTQESEFSPVAVLETKSPPDDAVLQLYADLFFQRGISATSLNNYLQSPWQYLYRNILRVPQVQATHLLYGTAMHGVMEQVTRQYRVDQKVPSTSAIKKILDAQLAQLPLSTEEHATLHQKGMESLAVYLEHAAKLFSVHSKEEFMLRVQLPTNDPDLGEILLTGMLDRLDMDEAGKVLRVMDYKTGKPKTRGYIEGTTKDSDGGYKRQLVFYALMLSLYEDERYACREGVLTFIEPEKNGSIREETFIITDQEIEDLKAEIIAMARAIKDGTFLNQSCDPEKCDYCDLVK